MLKWVFLIGDLNLSVSPKKVKVLVTQLFLTLCNPVDCSPPGFSVHGILQARILEWIAISSSRGSSWPRDEIRVSCTANGFFTTWTTREAPMQVKFILVTNFLKYSTCKVRYSWLSTNKLKRRERYAGQWYDCRDMDKPTTIHISLSILVDFGIQPELQSVKVKTF